jgi:predicted NodU family carbamoyl transferase/glycosyltransferase involved in cell wall biosynthesis
MSLGKLWGRMTRMVFKLQAGYPRGHQAGSVMAMSSMGNPDKYYEDLKRMVGPDFHLVDQQPPGYVKGKYVKPEDDVIHPYLNKYRLLAEDEQEAFNIAASLQKVTEEYIFECIGELIEKAKDKGFYSNNLCLSGGVSLNSVCVGKIIPFFKNTLKNIFVPPVPYDGGLNIGAAQYYWHHVLDNPKTNTFVTPYLGEKYSSKEVTSTLENFSKKINTKSNITNKHIVDLLTEGKLVAVFQGRSESGRRALGNRSILADPTNPNIKDIINKKVKHRQWYRPFAPSVLEDYANEWFENYQPSPYMSHVLKFKQDKLGKAPGVEHFDQTARLQTVKKDQNPNYYKLINEFYLRTGIPMLLNTSFNDREPICETPEHSLNCFLGTDIDYLYFADEQILVSKKTEKITFVIPSRNNLEFLQLAYKSIRNLTTKHEILVLNDASTDGTEEWITSLNDPDLIAYHNPGPERIGIVGMFDKGIEMARTDIIFAFHADMVAAPDLDKHILKYLKKGKVVSATRVEPPLHPDGPEKMLVDFGIEVEDFDIDKFNNWVTNDYKPKHGVLTTEGIFAPWCMYKDDFLAIGGHDELFAPQSKEDSDLFNRFILNGYNVIQTWEGLVYHFTSRGSRFNKHVGGAAGKNSDEWLHTTTTNLRKFIKKWGTVVQHDKFMKPIISPVYNKTINIINSTPQLKEILEPWGNGGTDIIVKVDGNTFNQQDYEIIKQLNNIIKDSGAIGEFEIGNISITINSLEEHQNKLIKAKTK